MAASRHESCESFGVEFPSVTRGANSGSVGVGDDVRQSSARVGCCGLLFVWRRSFLVVCLVCCSAGAAAYIYLPSYIAQARLARADIKLDSAMVAIGGDTTNLLSPRVQVRAPQSLLALPLISFVAHILPFTAQIFVDVDAPKQPGDSEAAAPPQVARELATMHVNETLVINSVNDVNMSVGGELTITGPEHLGILVNRFIKEKTVAATIVAKVNCFVWIWGFIPMYIYGIEFTYTEHIPAFNNFSAEMIALDEIVAAEGKPSNLIINCTAFVFNPSPMSISVSDLVRMNVAYEYRGASFIVGQLGIPALKLEPGRNIANANFTVQQRPDNDEAIQHMITAYMGGTLTGLGPGGTNPMTITILDAGPATANSKLLQTALAGLSVAVNFRPKPIYFVKAITADIVIGGSLIHWPPQLYNATVHISVMNPLPTAAKLIHVKLSAEHLNDKGENLYNFIRTEEQLLGNEYVVPPQVDHVVSFQLHALTEANVATGIRQIEDLATEALAQNVSVGVQADLIVMVGGYRQLINYANSKLSSSLCFHATIPTEMCHGVGGHKGPKQLAA